MIRDIFTFIVEALDSSIRRASRPVGSSLARRGGRPRSHSCVAILFLAVDLPAKGASQFIDRSWERGIGAYEPQPGFGSGVAAADYDNDGDVDMFVPQAAGVPDLLYRNRGDGTFEEVAGFVGLNRLHSSRVALWLDHDGDHDLDLFIANDDVDAATAFHLYMQTDDGDFVDVSRAAGVFRAPVIEASFNGWHHRGGLCAGDVNQDGYVDIFTVQFKGAGVLFINNRNGSFRDESEASGVASISAHQHQAVMVDVNLDGVLDLYVAVDAGPNILWINDGHAVFTDRAAAQGAANSMNDMGIAVGDYDNDGDPDIYVTNIFLPFLSRHNILLRNDLPVLSEVSESQRVADGGWGWGTTFLDADRDGKLDIAATNGWAGGATEWLTDPSRLFMNRGNDFQDAGAEWGFNDPFIGSTVIAFDFDRDGDLDLVQTCMDGLLRVMENQPADTDANYLVVKPRMSGPNHYGIGAVVRAGIGQTALTRYIQAGTSYLGQEPYEAFFGLGAAASVDQLDVYWPDGTTSQLTSVAANQVLIVTDVLQDSPVAAVPATSGASLLLLMSSIVCAGSAIIAASNTRRIRPTEPI